MRFLNTFFKAVAAGGCISIGGAVYLSCESKALGAFLFAVGLFAICVFGLNLYTGKIGYLLETEHKWDIAVIWLGNLVGCGIGGGLLRTAKPAFVQTVSPMLDSKLAQNPLQTLILGFFCGILMYIAVDNYRNSNADFGRVIGIFICVPAFILCGFEHSVADMAYFATGLSDIGKLPQTLLFLILVSLGNAIGAILFHLLAKKEFPVGKK